MQTQTCDQGVIQGGVVDNLLQLGGKLIGGIVSQQQGKNPTKQVGGNLLNGIVGKNPTKQLGNQLLNGLVGNQQQKLVNVQVTQKPQVGENWSGFPTYFFGDTLQVAWTGRKPAFNRFQSGHKYINRSSTSGKFHLIVHMPYLLFTCKAMVVALN